MAEVGTETRLWLEGGGSPRQPREFPPPHTLPEPLTTSWKAGEQRSCSHMTHTFSHTLTPSATTWYSPPPRGGIRSPAHTPHMGALHWYTHTHFFFCQIKFTFNTQSLMQGAIFFSCSDDTVSQQSRVGRYSGKYVLCREEDQETHIP